MVRGVAGFVVFPCSMKFPSLAALLFLVFCAPARAGSLDVAPTHPATVANIAWGATPDEAKRALFTRPGVVLVSETPKRLMFSGGDFADQPAEKWELGFDNGRFSEITVILKADNPLSQYEAVTKMITEKYRTQGREERESAEHRATYWEFAKGKGRWGIVCDVRIPERVLIKYRDKGEVPTFGRRRNN
jgi:hypothetical protein